MKEITSVEELELKKWYHLYDARSGEYRGSHQLLGGDGAPVPFCYFTLDNGATKLWAETHNDQVTDRFIVFGPLPDVMMHATDMKGLLEAYFGTQAQQ